MCLGYSVVTVGDPSSCGQGTLWASYILCVLLLARCDVRLSWADPGSVGLSGGSLDNALAVVGSCSKVLIIRMPNLHTCLSTYCKVIGIARLHVKNAIAWCGYGLRTKMDKWEFQKIQVWVTNGGFAIKVCYLQ